MFQERKAPITSYYGSWKNWLPIMRAYEAGSPAYFATRVSLRLLALYPPCHQSLIHGLTLPPSACQPSLRTQYLSQAHHVFDREPR